MAAGCQRKICGMPFFFGGKRPRRLSARRGRGDSRLLGVVLGEVNSQSDKEAVAQCFRNHFFYSYRGFPLRVPPATRPGFLTGLSGGRPGGFRGAGVV